ncbi:hypothetical protein [Candidatus Leptofilum sp.]|uniref:hypothetical protein n=1 Tax=Candidatus Leptofilum sp. TaxID=3241576 RepID=UPI003B5AECEF
MKTINILLSAAMFLLIGCTAVTITPTAEEPQETAVPPTTSIPEEQPVNTDTPQAEPNNESEPIAEPEPTPTEEDKQVSEPVTVNLGDVTPVPIDLTPIVQPAPGNPGVRDPIVQAMNDLSQRLGVAVEDIELVSLLEVTWRDGSIGCPEEGVAYTQALVDGQQLILQAEGTDYYYHSGKGGVFTYCNDPVPPLDNASLNPNPLHPNPGQDD